MQERKGYISFSISQGIGRWSLQVLLTAVFQDDALKCKGKTGRDQGVALSVGDTGISGGQLALDGLYRLETMNHGCLGERWVGCNQFRGSEA